MKAFDLNTAQFTKGLNGLERKISRTAPKLVKRASQRALNLTARKTHTVVRRELAKAKGVAQKEIKNVVKPYNASLTEKRLESSVWIGLKRGIPFESLTTRVAKKRLSKEFTVRFPSGHVGRARRILPSTHSKTGRSHNLPIDHKIRLNPEARTILKRQAAITGPKVMRPEYIRQLKLALKKLNSAGRK